MNDRLVCLGMLRLGASVLPSVVDGLLCGVQQVAICRYCCLLVLFDTVATVVCHGGPVFGLAWNMAGNQYVVCWCVAGPLCAFGCGMWLVIWLVCG